jgi:hypothetical protein
MSSKSFKAFYKKAFIDKRGNLVLWQKPNLPLLGWLVFMILSKLLDDGSLKTGIQYIAQAFLVIWAVLEITKGSSYFRRLLGVIILAWIIASHLLS